VGRFRCGRRLFTWGGCSFIIIDKLDLKTLYINAVLGDGSIYINKGGSIRLSYFSTSEQLIDLKEKVLHKSGYAFSKRGTQISGYGSDTIIHNAFTKGIEELKHIHKGSVVDTINKLSEMDLFLWYIDDGSWHISRNTMHLYSNSLNKDESEVLIKRIEYLTGTRPALRIDRKNDGRSFYYLYFPRNLVRSVRERWLKYCIDLGLSDFYYKFGGLDYTDKESPILSDEIVREIRRMYEDGKTVTDISDKLSLKYSRVYRIVRGETYKNVV